VPVLDGFTSEFKFRMSNGQNFSCQDGSLPGADGLAFVIQFTGIDAIGFAGGGMGYENLNNSLAVEFDTFSNDSSQIENYHDPNGNHVAIQCVAKGVNTAKHGPDATLGINPNIMLLKSDGTVYYARIEYNLEPKVMKVYLDTIDKSNNLVLTAVNLDLRNLMTLDRGYKAYVGFTAATGCAVQAHDIMTWSLCPSHPNPASDVGDNPIAINSVEELDCSPNPFVGTTKITLNLDHNDNVTVAIYDMLGYKIDELGSGFMPAGSYSFDWKPVGIDRGIYLCRVDMSRGKLVKKIIMLK
jgi:hypothetical protein